MVSSHPDNERARKEKTIKAHSILLKIDTMDVSGSVTFHFSKGQGIVNHEIRICEKWIGATNENKYLNLV